MPPSDFASRVSVSIMPTAEQIRKVSEFGLRHVELGPLEENEPKQTTDALERIASVKDALHSCGITPTSMHAPYRGGCDFGSFDEAARRVAFRHHVRQLGFCAQLGVAYYVVHPGGLLYAKWDEQRKVGIWPHDHEFAEKLWKLNARFLAELADSAEDSGIKVCLENGWFNDPNFMTLQDFLLILREVNRDNVGACIDTGHANVGMAVKPSDVIRNVGSMVWTLHLHDNDGTGDQHLPPGKGNIDWRDVIEALREISYTGTLNLETDPKDGVPFMRSLLAQIAPQVEPKDEEMA